MGNLKKYVFGRSKGVLLNTFIGGVASTINTASLLATKIQISTSRITSFSVVGNDIQCKIDGTYAMPVSAFEGLPNTNNNAGITFYIDAQNICISLGVGSFSSNQQQMLITEINFGGVISVGYGSFLGYPSRSFIKKIILPQATTLNGSKVISALPDLELVYIPRCTVLGASVGDNEIFSVSKLKGTVIYANPFLQTNNSGGIDGDLQFAISGGAIVRYVTNFTAPNPVTTLSAGAIYNTAIQLNLTAPSGANAIDYYEVYVNGVFNKIITASGQYISVLTANTFYNITVVSVDIFYNKSVVSNNLLVSTSNVVYNDSDANAYISASTLTNNSDLESTQLLVKGLKDNFLWNKIQAGYLFKGNTANNQKYNIKNPLDTNAAFRLIFNGIGTHSSSGYTSNATTGYANTNFIPSTNQNLNSNGLTLVVGTNNITASGDVIEFGSFNGASKASYLAVKRYNTNFLKDLTLNSQGTTQSATQSNVNESRGIFTGSKTSLNIVKLIRNNIILGTGTSGGTLPTLPIWIGALNLNNSIYGASNQRIQIALIHEGLSDAEVTTLHSIIDISETIAGRKTW
jgi:hypothetical protein